MNNLSWQAYPHIVRFIRRYISDSKLSDRGLLTEPELDVAESGVLLRHWLNGVDVGQALRYLQQDYTRQQLQSAMQVMASAKTHRVRLKTFSTDEFRRRAARLMIQYGVVETPFGEALLGFTEDGICHVSFYDGRDAPEAILSQQWRVAGFVQNPIQADRYLRQMFDTADMAYALSAWTYGTDFQTTVWRTLMQLPSGGLISYQQLAEQVGAPGAARAVGTAMAKNHLVWLMPCHRVLRQSGEFGHFGGGTERKMAMVLYEAVRANHNHETLR